MIEIVLSQVPVPKSNRYVRRKGGKVFKPPRVKNWEVRALWEISQQYSGKPLEGKLSMDVVLVLPNNRKRDIDNMLKSLWDILERAGVIKNDHQIYEIRTIKKVIKGEQKTIVRIKEFTEDH
ncbi:Crossover junction endodeoxyribonuclease [Hydrogenobacter thermophilus TK-6]|uniref:Crossover junction endodeoxyribonuclease RusA n=1 Tax=Hydrogenobacter thermophilus (strain DSM 6534 / IAM 12695 / TK-6) TaxID=608538 RepID=D3DIN5_HYDTT|nr:RusA family crossover junction endodeoxyribonuclease [Hydrogenobacter thermophilus]ADO45613.1 Crossover junction endodeoxyribonuclease [Hydrogenobacter thermophilus TK-6]BAI69687.1 endodeoxyribonuclease [Hydrogenobacter thermophilus TK-6]